MLRIASESSRSTQLLETAHPDPSWDSVALPEGLPRCSGRLASGMISFGVEISTDVGVLVSLPQWIVHSRASKAARETQ